MKKRRCKKYTKLRQRLDELGLTQSELSRRMNRDVKLVNHACSSGIKTVRVAEIYAPYCDCDPLDLLDVSGRPAGTVN